MVESPGKLAFFVVQRPSPLGAKPQDSQTLAEAKVTANATLFVLSQSLAEEGWPMLKMVSLWKFTYEKWIDMVIYPLKMVIYS